jgi:hypothetical protein
MHRFSQHSPADGRPVRYHLYLLSLALALSIHNKPLKKFMPVIPSTSGRLQSEFVRLLFLQTHRETDLFFTVSGVQSVQSTSGFFHFRHAASSTGLKSKVGLPLPKAAALRYWRVCIVYVSTVDTGRSDHGEAPARPSRDPIPPLINSLTAWYPDKFRKRKEKSSFITSSLLTYGTPA